MTEFIEVLKMRRSIYDLGQDSKYGVDEIVTRLREVQALIPSSFNSQTSRLVVVTGDKHIALWELIYSVQKDVLNEAMWDKMSPTMLKAKEGIGTVIFFEDHDEIAKMPTKGARTIAYMQNNSANLQLASWLTLAEMDLGASLQHFNIGYEQGFDKAIRDLLELPDTYEMIAQMPFGSFTKVPAEKPKVAAEIRVQHIG